MKYEIELMDDGHWFLKKDGKIVLVTKYKARLLDIVEDFITNDGHSKLLEPKPSELGKLFEL